MAKRAPVRKWRTRAERTRDRIEARRDTLTIAVSLAVIVVMLLNYYMLHSDGLVINALAAQNEELRSTVVNLSSSLRVMGGPIEGIVVCEVGVQSEVQTPIGYLRISSSETSGAPRLKVQAKDVDTGKIYELPLDGTWYSDVQSGYEIQVAPESGWEVFDVGEDNKITSTHIYFTIQWRKDLETAPVDDSTNLII